MADSYLNFQPSRVGDHATNIQTRIDEIVASGKPSVLDLGNYLWVMTKGITIDPTMVKVVGKAARMIFDSGDASKMISSAITFTTTIRHVNFDSRSNSIPGADGKGASPGSAQQGTFEVGEVYGNPDTCDIAFLYEQMDSQNQEFSAGTLYNVYCHGFQRHHIVGQNAYMVKAFNCTFRAATVYSVGIKGGQVNGGEMTEFYACTMADSKGIFQVGYDFSGVNRDWYWFGGSWDYPQTFFWRGTTGGRCYLIGTHIEGRRMSDNGNPSLDWYFDNGTLLAIVYGSAGYASYNGQPDSQPHRFNMGGGGGSITMDHVFVGNDFDPGLMDSAGKPLLCSDPDRFQYMQADMSHGASGYDTYYPGRPGSMSWNWGCVGRMANMDFVTKAIAAAKTS